MARISFPTPCLVNPTPVVPESWPLRVSVAALLTVKNCWFPAAPPKAMLNAAELFAAPALTVINPLPEVLVPSVRALPANA